MPTALTTDFNYVYPGILTTEVFFRPVIDDSPALSDIAIIDPGISFRKIYNVVPNLDKILKPYVGCSRTYNGTVAIGNVTLEVKEFELNLEWCKDDFTQQLAGKYNNLAQEWLKTGINSFDPSGTPVARIIDQVIETGLRRDIARRIFFGDQDSSSADWNTINGIWPRLIDSSGGSNYCVRRATGTTLGTAAVTPANAMAALQAVYDQSSDILKSNFSKLKFYVTGSIYDAYVRSLQGIGAGLSEQAYTATVDGVKRVTFNGIPLIPIRLWDEFLNDPTNPLYATSRNLILLTIKENHIIGVENSADLNKVEGWYERKDRKYYFEGNMKFGYQYLHCQLSTIAY
jgi:hypothetical protein